MKTRIKVIINGKICTGRAGQTLLEIAQNNGIEIPNLCHNGELKHYGGCSLCVVEAEGSPKLLRACSTVAQDGQVIYTESERVVRTRKTSIELLMSDHDGDCRGPCVLNCPASVNAQGYVQAIARGDDKEAVRIIKERLPMPACIGRVCPHPCEDGCRRQMVEESISIAYLKYFAADRVIQAGGYLPPKAAATGKRVGIIGGGLPVLKGAPGDRCGRDAPDGRNASVRNPGIPAAQTGAGRGGCGDCLPGCGDEEQFPHRHGCDL